MSRRLRAMLLLAVLLVPLVPTGSAGIPLAASWSPWRAPQTVTSLALAEQGETIAATIAAYNPQTQCPPTQIGCSPVAAPTAPYDLAVLTLSNGFQAAGQEGRVEAAPAGRSHVDVSADGTTVVSLGREPTTSGSGSATLTLYYNRAGRDNNWTIAGSNVSHYLQGNALGVLTSTDGRRVLAAAQVGPNITIYGFTFDGALAQAFPPRVLPGQGAAIAASDDLSRFALVGVLPVANTNLSTVVPFRFAGGQENLVYRVPEGVNLTRVAVSADGTRVAAGGSNGTLLLFRGALENPQTLAIGNATVSAIAFAGDASTMAAAAETELRAWDIADFAAAPRWNRTLTGAVRMLDYNHTGGILMAATADGVRGLGPQGAELWHFNGDTSAVDINRAGTAFAYAQRDLVYAATVPRGLIFTFEGGADLGPTRTIRPGGNATYDLVVRNPGAAPERVVFQGPSDLDVDIEFDPPVLTVNPDAIERVKAIVRAGSITSGSRGFNVSAVSMTSGLRDDVTLNFTLDPVTDVALVLNVTEVTMKREDRSEVILTIQNTGTKSVAISIRAEQSVSRGPAWNVSIEPSATTIPPGTITTSKVIVRPPPNVENGTSNAITYYLEGQDVADQARIVYRINPTLGIELEPSARVKYVEAGQSGTFNITVKNTGSLPRLVSLFHVVNETSGRSWLVDMPTDPFLLEPDRAKVVTIKVTAPVEARPPDQLKFTVTAELVPEGDEPTVRDSVPLFANAAEPVRPTEDEDQAGVIPGPSVALVAAAFLVGALVLRRRRSP